MIVVWQAIEALNDCSRSVLDNPTIPKEYALTCYLIARNGEHQECSDCGEDRRVFAFNGTAPICSYCYDRQVAVCVECGAGGVGAYLYCNACEDNNA